MANKSTLELINLYIELHAERRTFKSKNEYLAWRSGLLAGLIATMADYDSIMASALLAEIKRLRK